MAKALGVKVNARLKKSDIIDKILDTTGSSSTHAPAAPVETAPIAAPNGADAPAAEVVLGPDGEPLADWEIDLARSGTPVDGDETPATGDAQPRADRHRTDQPRVDRNRNEPQRSDQRGANGNEPGRNRNEQGAGRNEQGTTRNDQGGTRNEQGAGRNDRRQPQRTERQPQRSGRQPQRWQPQSARQRRRRRQQAPSSPSQGPGRSGRAAGRRRRAHRAGPRLREQRARRRRGLPRHPRRGLRLPACQRLSAEQGRRLHPVEARSPVRPAQGRPHHRQGPSGRTQREEPGPARGVHRQRWRPRARQEAAALREPHRTVPRSASDAGGSERSVEHDGSHHRSRVTDRQGPARHHRVAAQGRQDDDHEDDRQVDRTQQPRGAPDGAPHRRAARRGHRHASQRQGRGHLLDVRPSE